jgi:RNA polymerase sigma-70 factor, ECF subfamily
LFSDDVVAGVKSGDPDAVGTVYVALADRLLGYVLARVQDRAAAEDILEATFVELLQRGSSINGEGAAIKSWLFSSAHFNALDHLRARRRSREQLEGDVSRLDVEDLRRGPEAIAEAAEDVAIVHAAMEHLSEDQRAVLLLRYIAGLTAREVAEVLQKSDGAVRSLQHRGERALAKLLTHGAAPASSATGAASKVNDDS